MRNVRQGQRLHRACRGGEQAYSVGGHPAEYITRRWRWFWTAAVLAAVTVSSAAVAAGQALAQEQALAVEGRVVNGTAGGGGVEGLTVVLYQGDGTAFQERRATTDVDGGFRFDRVGYSPDLVYGVSVQRLGITYGAGLDLSDGSPQPITLTVYDAASDDSVVAVESASMLVSSADRASETVWVLEIVHLVNDTDVAYAPGPEPMSLLRFGLPAGARDLQVDTTLVGADVLQVDRGFALTAGVPPGSHEVMFAYRFPYQGAEATFTKTLRYGAGTVRVLAPMTLVELAVEGLGEPGVATIGEREYRVYEGGGLARGAQLSVRLEGLPQASLGERLGARLGDLPLEYAGPAGLGVMTVLVVATVLWRRRGMRARGLSSS